MYVINIEIILFGPRRMQSNNIFYCGVFALWPSSEERFYFNYHTMKNSPSSLLFNVSMINYAFSTLLIFTKRKRESYQLLKIYIFPNSNNKFIYDRIYSKIIYARITPASLNKNNTFRFVFQHCLILSPPRSDTTIDKDEDDNDFWIEWKFRLVLMMN